MSLKYIFSKFLILFVAFIYFIFSCGYVTKCKKTTDQFIFSHHKSCDLHLPKRETQSVKHSATGNFLTRPRVISQDNKIVSKFVAVVVLSCLFIGFNNKKEYFYPFIFDFNRHYSSNLVVILGSLRI